MLNVPALTREIGGEIGGAVCGEVQVETGPTRRSVGHRESGGQNVGRFPCGFSPGTEAAPSPRPDSATSPQPTAASSKPPEDRVPAWRAGFLKLLPDIQRQARLAFRGFKREAREEAVQEVVVNAMVAYARLVELGKRDVAFAGPLAGYAVAQYRVGRLVATKLNVCDITSFHCQRRKGLVVERLDRWDCDRECWREVLVEDKTCTPAELAASRIDFEAWLDSLPGKKRRIARTLAAGHGTIATARRHRISPARISQMRKELQTTWREFHEPVRPAAE